MSKLDIQKGARVAHVLGIPVVADLQKVGGPGVEDHAVLRVVLVHGKEPIDSSRPDLANIKEEDPA